MKLLKNRRFITLGAILGADFIVFGLIDPRRSGALWLIVGYLMLGATFYLLAHGLNAWLRAYSPSSAPRAGRYLRYGLIVVFALVGLQSIGQLSVRDVATFLPFTLLACWYWRSSRRLGWQPSSANAASRI